MKLKPRVEEVTRNQRAPCRISRGRAEHARRRACNIANRQLLRLACCMAAYGARLGKSRDRARTCLSRKHNAEICRPFCAALPNTCPRVAARGWRWR